MTSKRTFSRTLEMEHKRLSWIIGDVRWTPLFRIGVMMWAFLLMESGSSVYISGGAE